MATRWLVVLAIVASCGVRAPARIDVAALVRARGPVEARRDLEIRILADPKDGAARLALAALDDAIGRPSEAIAQLAAVEALGGPLGVRWHDDDRARFARLLLARGRIRLAREAPTALADLDRARRLGARVDDADLVRARIAIAIGRLRHTDTKTREVGRRDIASLVGTPHAQPGWRGARIDATVFDRASFGVWLWSVGARRASWEELAAWHDATAAPRDPALEAAYVRAFAWWTPSDLAPPSEIDLVGAERCRYRAPGCRPGEVARADVDAQRALLAAPIARTADPADAAGWAELALVASLRGDDSWGAAIAARVDLGAFAEPRAFAALPPHVRPIFARLLGRREPTPSPANDRERLVVGAERAVDGATAADVRAALGPLADTDDGRALLAIAEPHAPDAAPGDPSAPAAARYVAARFAGSDEAALAAIAAAFRIDPAVAERLGRDHVAAAADDAIALAQIGALFDALGDPARARNAWQGAVDASGEIDFYRGLALAQAREGDADAALINATTAAAGSGDPAVVWAALATVLAGAGKPQQALEAARSAIDLGSAEVLGGALDAAIAASRALDREDQARALASQRAAVAPSLTSDRGDADPTDAAAALAAHRSAPTDATLARLWIASRWNPRDVASRAALRTALAAGDPRRALVEAELLALAGDRDSIRALDAAAALR